jgi:heptaprenyl diphosphate synthase
LFVPVFWISCGGGLLSFAVMAMLTGRRAFSVIGTSLAGAVAHNMGQLVSAAVLLDNTGIFYYLPWLLLWSMPMGLFTGFSARSAIKALSSGGINGRM